MLHLLQYQHVIQFLWFYIFRIKALIVTFNLNVWILLLAGFFEAFFGGGLLSIYAQVAAIVVDIIRISHAKKDLTVTTEKISHDTWIWFTVFESIALLCSSSGSPIGGLYTQLINMSQNV